MVEKKQRQGKRMREQFTITVPLVITFNPDMKYKKVQELYKALVAFLESQAMQDYDISLGKGKLEKHTVY